MPTRSRRRPRRGTGPGSCPAWSASATRPVTAGAPGRAAVGRDPVLVVRRSRSRRRRSSPQPVMRAADGARERAAGDRGVGRARCGRAGRCCAAPSRRPAPRPTTLPAPSTVRNSDERLALGGDRRRRARLRRRPGRAGVRRACGTGSRPRRRRRLSVPPDAGDVGRGQAAPGQRAAADGRRAPARCGRSGRSSRRWGRPAPRPRSGRRRRSRGTGRAWCRPR